MSLDTGKKLGVTSALIFIIAPVIIASLSAVFFISLIGNISSTISNGGIFPTYSMASFGLILLGIVVAAIIIIIGIILFLIAMNELSHYYNEPGIFRNIIYALIVYVVGQVIIVTVTAALTFAAVANGVVASSATSMSLSFLGLFIGVTIASFVVAIVSAILVMRAFNKLGDKSEVHSFNTAAILLLIGAIIPVIGFILFWIGLIFVLSGFFSLKPKQPAASTHSGMPNPPYVNQNVIKCPQCGAENSINAEFCWSCGKQLK
jgi:uncharacterized membrane protein